MAESVYKLVLVGVILRYGEINGYYRFTEIKGVKRGVLSASVNSDNHVHVSSGHVRSLLVEY